MPFTTLHNFLHHLKLLVGSGIPGSILREVQLLRILAFIFLDKHPDLLAEVSDPLLQVRLSATIPANGVTASVSPRR